MTPYHETEAGVAYQGDCLDLMADIEDNSIDMILCDLPYGTTACKWDTIIPFEPLWAHYKRVTKPNAAIVLTASQPFTSALVMSNPRDFRHEWVWRKSRPSGQFNAKRGPLKDLESVLVFCRESPNYRPQGVTACQLVQVVTPGRAKGQVRGRVSEGSYTQTATGYPRQVLDFQSVHTVGAFHPTQKPVALMEYLIKTYTNEGDTVLDNCAGSGTTAIACIKTGRKYILIEKEPEYCETIARRIDQETEQKTLPLPLNGARHERTAMEA